MTIAPFSVRLRRPFLNYFEASNRFVAVPEWWSDMANGGPDLAQVRLEGHHESMAEAFRMLNWEVEIRGPLGGALWWGYINAVDVNFGGTMVSLSLDDVYNAVRVAYVQTGAGGNIERNTTAWAEDARSIERYGRREVLLSMSEGGQTAAERYRDRFLAQSKSPVPTTRLGGGNAAATLHCRGHWYKLARRYYLNLDGLEEFTQGGTGVQGIGNYYANTTISFALPNQINDSANGFGHLAEGDRVFVRGVNEADNSGWHTVDTVTAGQILTVGQGIVNESAGGIVVLSATTEFGAAAIGQSFQLSESDFTGWDARRVAVQVRRAGSVTDSLNIDIRADNAGQPAAAHLARAQVLGSTIREGIGWFEAALDAPVTLAANTTYWLVVSRSGYWDSVDHPARLAQHYAVNVNEDLGYGHNFLVASDTAWQTRDPDAHMPFRVLGRVPTTEQMETIVGESELANTDLGVDSGIETWQYREGDRTLLDELDSLIAIGTDGANRILADVQPGRIVRIVQQTAAPGDASNLVLSAGGALRALGGHPLETGQLVAGRYVTLEFLPLLDAVSPNDVLFIERSRYDASTGELSIETEGNESIWQLGVLPG